MMKRLIVYLAVVMLLATSVEIAVSWSWPKLFLSFHIYFIVVAALTFFIEWRQTLWYALIHGFILDLYSPQLFGLYMVTGFILTVCIAIFQATWLKQRSILSVVTITAISFSIVELIVHLWQWGSEQLHLSDYVLSQFDWKLELLSWFIMVMITALCVRLISPRYEKFL